MIIDSRMPRNGPGDVASDGLEARGEPFESRTVFLLNSRTGSNHVPGVPAEERYSFSPSVVASVQGAGPYRTRCRARTRGPEKWPIWLIVPCTTI